MISLVVHTCDKYNFCWDPWYYFIEKNWTLEWPIYFLNEVITIDYKGVTQIKTGEGEWSTRLKRGLKLIPTDYILYMQEDMWLYTPLDTNLFNFCADLCEVNSINKLIVAGMGLKDFTEHRTFAGFKYESYGVYNISKTDPCLMSHQPAIWNKAFFDSVLPEGEDPWSNETRGTVRLQQYSGDLKFYTLVLNTNADCVWYRCVHRYRRGFTEEGNKMLREYNEAKA